MYHEDHLSENTATLLQRLIHENNICLFSESNEDHKHSKGKVTAVHVAETWLHSFLTSALDGDEWSASGSSRFKSGNHWKEGWEGPTAGLGVLWEKSLPHFCCDSNPAPYSSYYTDWANTEVIFQNACQSLGDW